MDRTAPHQGHFGCRKGFNLIELLIVIAIIGILAALLFPAFSRAKASAKNAHCQNNLQQLMVGVHTFAGDNGHYPLTTDHPTSNTWYTVISEDYASSYDLMKCPTFKGEYEPEDAMYFMLGGFGGFRSPTTPDGIGGVSYGYNGYGIGEFADSSVTGNPPLLGLGGIYALTSGNVRQPTVQPHSIVNAAEMVGIADSMPQANYPWLYGSLLTINTRNLPDKNRHGGNDNVVFVDGHVGSIPHLEFIDDTEVNRRRWNSDNKPHYEIHLNPAPSGY